MKKILSLAPLAIFALLPLSSVEATVSAKRSVLENGLVVLTSEEPLLPMVTLNLLIEGGAIYDPSQQEGVAHLTSRLLTYGTKNKSALEIGELLDFIGARFRAESGDEAVRVSLTLLKKDLDTGLDLLTEILTSSVFPPEEVQRQRQSILASIRAKKEDPGAIAQKAFFEALYPASPYGRPVEGTEESVRKIERSHVLDFYRKFYRPNRAILSVVGDITHEDMIDKLNRVLQSWEKSQVAADPPPPPATGAANVIRIDKNLTQANIVIGHDGVSRGNPDYYAIQIMNYILGGGGFSSRLMDKIRNEKGFAYSVYSFFSAGKSTGSFQIVMQTRNQSAQEAIQITIEEIRRLREAGPSDQEIQAAKDYLTGSFAIRLNTNRRIARFLAQVEYYQLGLDYPERYPDLIRKITREDVIRVARKYLVPENFITVMVANLKKLDGGN